MMTEQDKKVISLTQELIRKQSYSGAEENVAAALKEYMENTGVYDLVSTDVYGNVIGRITGKKRGPVILFDGHIDTVPVQNAEEWKHDPFAAEIENERLYGRGASDMKGSVAAFTVAAEYFARECDKGFAGVIYVAGVVHEECFEGVAARKISEAVKPDYVVIGEASELNLKIGQRGRAEVVVETFGVSAHSANPEKGVNAVYKMCKAIEAIQQIIPPEQEKLGKGILELTDVKSAPYPGASVVPEYCRATYDRRLLVGETRESVLEAIENKLKELAAQDSDFRYRVSYAVGKEICYTGLEISEERFFPGWLFDEKEEYIQAIREKLNQNGYHPRITNYNFCTNGSHYAGEAGIKTIGLGPSYEYLAHTVDEYIPIDQLLQVTECYKLVMSALL